MKVFISYSSHDEAVVRSLVADLKRARVEVWLDEELGGGEAWWTAILEQIRACTVFVFALSDKSLYSRPCRTELSYAKALGLPILPAQVGEVQSYRADPIFSTQLIDYRRSNMETGFALMGALHDLEPRRVGLPDPLPDPPLIPYEYLQRLGEPIHDRAAGLTPAAQLQTLIELRTALNVEDDPTVLDDIRGLLRALRARSDVTVPIAGEIDAILSADKTEQEDPVSGGAAVSDPRTAAGKDDTQREDASRTAESIDADGTGDASRARTPAGAEDHGIASDSIIAITPPIFDRPLLRRLNRRTKFLLGAVAVVAVAAVAVVGVVVTTGKRSSSHAGIASSTTTTTEAFLTEAQSRLLDLVPSYKCTLMEASVGIAFVSCNSGATGVDSLDFTLFADQPSLGRAMAATPHNAAGSYAFEQCPGRTQPGPQDWHRASDPQQSAGKVACYGETVRWSVDSELLLGEASTNFGGFEQVYQWWEAGNQ